MPRCLLCRQRRVLVVTRTASSSSSSFTINIDDHIAYLMSQKATPLSLSTMYKYATTCQYQRLANAQFLHRELQIRIAHRLLDLKLLPFGLAETTPIADICHKYKDYLIQFTNCPLPKTKSGEAKFTNMLQTFVLDRHSVPSAIYSGLTYLKQHQQALSSSSLDQLELHIQKFMMARVGLRFLTEHHILCSPDIHVPAFRKQQGYILQDYEKDQDPCFLGAISNTVDPIRDLQRVAKHVVNDCRTTFGVSPNIEVVDGRTNNSITTLFTYVPHHLHFMLAELLKNSCRAVVTNYWSQHGNNQQRNLTSLQRSAQRILPPIRVVVAKGDEDITIKISDRGGGIPRSTCDPMWTFVHSTMRNDDLTTATTTTTTISNDEDCSTTTTSTNLDTTNNSNAFTNNNAVYGRSFGLPLARIYARYFGGELTLQSMEGFGVDAYLYLPVLGVECERLPERVYNSPGNLDSQIDFGTTTTASAQWMEDEKSTTKQEVILP